MKGKPPDRRAGPDPCTQPLLGNDYARTDRQRAVLMAIINKVKQMDAVSIVNFINQVLPLLTTDMTSGEILGYAMEALQMNFDSEHFTASRQRAPIPAR